MRTGVESRPRRYPPGRPDVHGQNGWCQGSLEQSLNPNLQQSTNIRGRHPDVRQQLVRELVTAAAWNKSVLVEYVEMTGGDRWFEEQFVRRETITTSGGYISVVDVTPVDYDAQHDRTPVVFVPGFLANLEGFQLTMKAFAATGKRVVSLTNSYQRSRTYRGESFPNVIIQKCEDLLTLVREKGLVGCDVVAHSAGFTVSVISSRIHSEAQEGVQPFRIIEGVAPHGLRRLDSGDALRGPMMIVQGAREMISHPNVGPILGATFDYLRKGARRMSQEAMALMRVEVADIVNELGPATDVGVLLVPGDEVISARKHYEMFERGSVSVSAVSTVVNRYAKHAAVLLDPITIGAAVAMLDSMRDARTSREERAT